MQLLVAHGKEFTKCVLTVSPILFCRTAMQNAERADLTVHDNLNNAPSKAAKPTASDKIAQEKESKTETQHIPLACIYCEPTIDKE